MMSRQSVTIVYKVSCIALFDEVVGITMFEGYWIGIIELFLCG